MIIKEKFIFILKVHLPFLQFSPIQSSSESSQDGTWATSLIEKFVHPLTIFLVPLIILAFLLIVLISSFRTSLTRGIRGFAASLLPFIIITFIYKFRFSFVEGIVNIDPIAGFIISLIWGFLIMRFLHHFLHRDPHFPVLEIILSSTFSLLLISYVNNPISQVLSYYYGTVSGFLIYIVFWGFPINYHN